MEWKLGIGCKQVTVWLIILFNLFQQGIFTEHGYTPLSATNQFFHLSVSMSLNLKEEFIDTANLRLAALISDNREDPPVIALHGWLDNAASFTPLAKILSDIQLIAIDFPGHGKSEHRTGANAYHFVDYAADIILAADALGLEKFTLLGHSLGAGVASMIAATVPERIKRLAMIEGLIPVTAPPENISDQLRRHITGTSKSASAPRIYATIEEAAVARRQAGDLSNSAASLIVTRNIVETPEGYIWRTDRRLTMPSPVYLTEDHVRAYLGKVKCESLLIRSSKGIFKQLPHFAGRESFLPTARIIDIEGGHHCHMDNPENVAKHLSPFLNRT